MSLSHHSPHCTGFWDVRHRGGAQYWKCDHCGAVSTMSEAVNSEAILENVRGVELARLSEEGQRLLEEGR